MIYTAIVYLVCHVKDTMLQNIWSMYTFGMLIKTSIKDEKP